LEKGTFQTGLPLATLLDKTKKDDIYVKGTNAIDPEGKVGVLYASLRADTMGKPLCSLSTRNLQFLNMVPTIDL
jgi:hypothetical protein